LRVAAFTGGKKEPSARFRIRQYVPALRQMGIEMREYWSPLGCYPPQTKALRPLWGAVALGERTLAAAASYFADLTLLQREMLSTLHTAERFTRAPRIFDVDDAIFLYRNGTAARRLARLSDAVICGNDFLAENFRRWNRNVQVLATAVDTDRYHPAAAQSATPVKRICWSGGSSNFRYLEKITPALRQLFEKRRDVIMRIIADSRPHLEGIAAERVEFVRWSPEIEVRAIQESSIGVMPLEDTPWARGKCSFKLLTYMACGVPVVASPVGTNAAVLTAGGGLGPARWDEWADALDSLLDDGATAARMAQQGREAAVNRYSVKALGPEFARILRSCQN